MIRAILILIASGISTLAHASLNEALDDSYPQAKSQLVVALQDNHPTTGTDSDTTSFPSAGMNTMPTNNTGTETRVQDSTFPVPPNYEQPPAYAPAPAYKPAPAYTPPH